MCDFARNSSTFSLCFALISLFRLLFDLGILFYKISSLFLIDNIWDICSSVRLSSSYAYLIIIVHTSSHYHAHCNKFNLFFAVILVLFYNCQLEHCSSSFCSILIQVHIFVSGENKMPAYCTISVPE